MNLPPELISQNMQEPEMDVEEPEQIFAHVSPEEIPYLNELQGEEIIDPETGLRDYTMIQYLLDIPEYRDAMEEATAMMHSKKMADGGHVEEAGRPTDPELEKLRLEGRNGDTELIIITPKIAEFFEMMNEGKTTINPHTGFPEYGFFKELLRIAAPIVGSIFGGPIGAFAASTATNKLTGKSWGDSLKQGVLAGGLSFAAPMVGLGGLSGAGSFGGFGGLGGVGKAVGLNSVGKMMPFGGQGAMTASGVGGASNMASQAAPQAGGQGFLSQLLTPSNLLTAGGLGASALMFAKGHKEDTKNKEDYERKNQQDTASARSRLGFDAPLRKVKPFDYGTPNFDISEAQRESGIIPRFYNYDLEKQYASTGGPITGHGKGQEDNIPRDIRENSYILDASTVSDIGDGSTDAGFKELSMFLGKVPSKNMMHKSGGGFIPAMVSDGEYEVSPEQVTALGGGSNQKGVKILEKLVKDIRAQKRTSGKKLPPKSKPIGGYLKRLNAA